MESLAQLLEKSDNSKLFSDQVIAEVACFLDTPEIYGFYGENQEIFSQLKNLNKKSTPYELPAKIIPRGAYPGVPIQFIAECLKNNRISDIASLKQLDDFDKWYKDATTFHPAFQYIYELATIDQAQLDQEQIHNLKQTLLRLLSCLIKPEQKSKAD